MSLLPPALPAQSLARRTWGSGPARALLLHGSTSSSATWWRVAPALAAAGWSVTALDLPSHGASPPLRAPGHPAALAAEVAADLEGERYDVLLGHSLGAVVALVLAAEHPELAGLLVLEEPAGPRSTHWPGEAEAVEHAAGQARRDRDGEVARTRAGQPRWQPADCAHAVDGLLACAVEDVAAGLRLGPTWPLVEPARRVQVPTLVLAAPDASGVNRLEDATALRGPDRQALLNALPAPHLRPVDTGHCVHQDDPSGWLDAVTNLAGVAAAAPARSGASGLMSRSTR